MGREFVVVVGEIGVGIFCKGKSEIGGVGGELDFELFDTGLRKRIVDLFFCFYFTVNGAS